MRFEFSGAELFLTYLTGQANLQTVFAHPAYQTIAAHAQQFGDGITADDIDRARAGRPSPFYGLRNLADNISQIQSLLQIIQAHQTEWLADIANTLHRIFPAEDLEPITVYPVIGYDMGIGLGEAVCLNLNWPGYLAEPQEFLYFIIHECAHVIYERHHRVPSLAEVMTPAQWLAYLKLWLQNEGYAVYTPFRLRQKRGHLADRDYMVLADSNQLETHRLAFIKTLAALQQAQPRSQTDYIDFVFGPRRLTYRLGCELIRQIEVTAGLPAVTAAFYLDGDAFFATYGHLIGAA